MYICVGEFLPCGLDEFVNELVVFLAASARLAQAQVEVVVQQFIILHS